MLNGKVDVLMVDMPGITFHHVHHHANVLTSAQHDSQTMADRET